MKKVAFSLATALALVLAMPVQGNAQGRDDPIRPGGGGSQERAGGGGGGGERLFRGGGGRDDGARVQRQRDNDGAKQRDRASDRLFLNRGNNDDRRRAGRDRDRRDDAKRRVDRDDRRDWKRWKRWRSGNRYRVVIIPSYSYGAGLGWCHFHRYRAAGMRAHRSVQCHYHPRWRNPSIVYVAGY